MRSGGRGAQLIKRPNTPFLFLAPTDILMFHVKHTYIQFQISASYIKRFLVMSGFWYKSNTRARRLHFSLLTSHCPYYI